MDHFYFPPKCENVLPNKHHLQNYSLRTASPNNKHDINDDGYKDSRELVWSVIIVDVIMAARYT